MFCTGSPDGNIKRTYRCAEMAYKSIGKLIAHSQHAPQSALTGDNPAAMNNRDVIEAVGQEAKSAVTTLGSYCKKEIEKLGKISPGKTKRVLPPSPLVTPNRLEFRTDGSREHKGVKRVFDLADSK